LLEKKCSVCNYILSARVMMLNFVRKPEKIKSLKSEK